MTGLLPFKFARHSRKNKAARKGVAALEFALVGPAFIFLVIVAFDLGMAVWMQSMLDQAAKDAARVIMINPNATSSAFLAAACADMGGMVPCGNLQYAVQSGGSFASLSPTTQNSSGANLNNAGSYLPGARGSDVIVQLAYNRPAVAPWTLVLLGGGTKTVSKSNLLIATVVFQNEPP